MPAAHCRTCGFTDCPGATTPGGCTRWPGTEPAPAARIGLIPDGMPEDTPAARRLGAWILGRALGHADDLDDTATSALAVRGMARRLGFAPSDTLAADRAYNELLWG